MTRRLEGSRIHYAVGGRTVLDGVDVWAEAGRPLAVTGASGSGKSSLLAVLAGLLPPDAGVVRLDGVLLADCADARLRFGIVLQGYGLVTALTAYENVALALQARGVAPAETRRRTSAILAEVGLTDTDDHLVEELSGGQQQRVAVARALVAEPDIVLADEPTAELDADNRGRVVDLLLDYAAAGHIVVLASHDPEVADRCTERLVLGATEPSHP